MYLYKKENSVSKQNKSYTTNRSRSNDKPFWVEKSVFTHKELQQSDSKYTSYVNPDNNPGALKRLRSKHNVTRTYVVAKPLHYWVYENSEDESAQKKSTKVHLQVGDKLSFTV